MCKYHAKGLTVLIFAALAYSLEIMGNTNQAAPQEPLDSVASTVINYTQPFDIQSDYVVATPHLKAFSAEVDSIMRVDTITRVAITGMASIDGPESLNRRLAKARAAAMEKYLAQTAGIPESIIETSSKGEDWGMFKQLVEDDPQIPAQKQVLHIINSKMSLTAKEGGIKHLDNGATWRYMADNIFPKMRCAEVTLNLKHRFIVPIPEEIIETDTVEIVEEEPVEIVKEESEVVEEPAPVFDEWRRNVYIKTDLPYWVMSWANLAFEIDLAPHWSFNLPIYFSAVNYFKRDIKFRTFSFQPGIRYWFNWKNTGAYLEAHYGMGWWNFAFGGHYRYQDHFRKTPTMGGGLAAGYRMPISSNGRWAMELGGGVGVYRLHYDRFQNRNDGKLIDSRKKTVFFIDNINISISYSFPYGKRYVRELSPQEKGGES